MCEIISTASCTYGQYANVSQLWLIVGSGYVSETVIFIWYHHVGRKMKPLYICVCVCVEKNTLNKKLEHFRMCRAEEVDDRIAAILAGRPSLLGTMSLIEALYFNQKIRRKNENKWHENMISKSKSVCNVKMDDCCHSWRFYSTLWKTWAFLSTYYYIFEASLTHLQLGQSMFQNHYCFARSFL